MPRTYQTRGFVCKTTSLEVLQFCLRFCDGVSGARWAYAQHVPPVPKVPHWHFVGLFEDRVYWKSVYDFAMDHDPHSSTDTCKKPRKAVRYLLHLDSPEKHPVPPETLITGGVWGPDELESWLESSSVASSLVETALFLWRDGFTPLEALSRLVSFGYEPFQISSSLQAYSRLHEFFTKFAPSANRCRGMGAVSRPHQGIHSPPLADGEETQVSDNQGKKTHVTKEMTDQDVFAPKRPENPMLHADSSGTNPKVFPACLSSANSDFQFSGNHVGAVISDVKSVFGPNVGLADFLPSNFSRVRPSLECGA